MQNKHSDAFNPFTVGSKLTWLEACQWLEQHGEAYCIATIVAEAGSVPRANGSKMVISTHAQFDTLGGGNLERQVIKKARKLLDHKQEGVSIERFSLTADLQQCCGGAVQVMLESINCQLPKVVIYGAGHVSQALCTILQQLPCHVRVIDNRHDWIEQITVLGVKAYQHDFPIETVNNLDKKSIVLIMTHDHALDFDLTKLAIERACFPYIGLIGSRGKKQRFEFRLKEQLSNPSLLEQLTCPIGLAAIQGKLPMQVAVSVSAQLMALFESIKSDSASQAEDRPRKEKQWQRANDTKKMLKRTPHG